MTWAGWSPNLAAISWWARCTSSADDVLFGLPRLMRGNLRGAGTRELMGVQMRPNLLAAGARRLQVRRRVPANLGLAARASFDLVPERHASRNASSER